MKKYKSIFREAISEKKLRDVLLKKYKINNFTFEEGDFDNVMLTFSIKDKQKVLRFMKDFDYSAPLIKKDKITIFI